MDREMIRQTALRIEEFIGDLQPLLELGERSFTHDPMSLDAGQRLVALIVADAAAINGEILRAVTGTGPASEAESFDGLQAIGAIDENTARILSGCAKVSMPHRSAERAQLYEMIVGSVPVWRSYLRQVLARL